MFNIKDFYSSITPELLNKALNFVSEYIYISKCEIDVINHARKLLLFNGSHNWIKKQECLFDMSMGAYNGAEVWELVGTYMLKLLSNKYNKNDFGFYRDDGLAVLKNTSEAVCPIWTTIFIIYRHNHKVLNDNPNETRISNCNGRNKDMFKW